MVYISTYFTLKAATLIIKEATKLRFTTEGATKFFKGVKILQSKDNNTEYYLVIQGELPNWVDLEEEMMELNKLDKQGYDWIILGLHKQGMLIRQIFHRVEHAKHLNDFMKELTLQGKLDTTWMFCRAYDADAFKWLGLSLRDYIEKPTKFWVKWHRNCL